MCLQSQFNVLSAPQGTQQQPGASDHSLCMGKGPPVLLPEPSKHEHLDVPWRSLRSCIYLEKHGHPWLCGYLSLPANEVHGPNILGASAEAKRPTNSFLSLLFQLSAIMIIIIWLYCSTVHGYCPAVLEIVLPYKEIISISPHTFIQGLI